MTLATGQTLQGRYRVVNLLGQGGMGAVYRAWDLRLKTHVAVKEMVPQPGHDAGTLRQFREQFEQEAVILAQMKHPHLVSVTDFFEEERNAYLVMSYIEGESLADWIARRGAPAESQVRIWAEQLLGALAYCHARGVIHRDIKPQNVIVTEDRDVILVDFGLVKLWDPDDPRTRTVMRGAGTPEYAPPEQWSAVARHTDARSDIYSLGATLYHVLTGQAPLTASDRMAFPKQFRTPSEFRADVSPLMDHVIRKAMALAQEDRWASADEMAAALSSRPQPVAQQARRRFPTRWLVGGAVALLLLLVSGSVFAARWLGSLNSPQAVATDTPQATRTNSPAASATPAAESSPSPRAAAGGSSDAIETATPLLRPTSTAKSTGALDPQPTATLAPTETPEPSPESTSTPSPTDTPACPTVQGPFADAWAARRDRLGCAESGAFSGLMAEETFEGGKMFWREPLDTAQALVAFNNGTWRIFQHAPFVEGSPEFPCADADTPAQCPPTPKRGFGAMWCDIPEIRNGLGNALDCERGYQGTFQLFDRGSALRTDTGAVYLFFDDGRWERR